MSLHKIESTDGSLLIKIAAIIIILAGAIYAKQIITPFILALFISIICEQPIFLLVKKGIQYESELTSISHSFIQFLNDKGL